MIDKKVIKKVLIVIVLLIIIIVAIVQIGKTLARYETTTSTERDVDVAFWVVDNSFQDDTIFLDEIYPSDTPYEYTFTVSNFDETRRVETDFEYDITITTTTNLPLEYEIQVNGVPCTKIEDLYADEDGTYYREIKIDTDVTPLTLGHTADETDTFVLSVKFPKTNYVKEDYADLIEYDKIELNASQIVEDT